MLRSALSGCVRTRPEPLPTIRARLYLSWVDPLRLLGFHVLTLVHLTAVRKVCSSLHFAIRFASNTISCYSDVIGRQWTGTPPPVKECHRKRRAPAVLELLAIGQGLNAVKTAVDLVRMVTGSTGRTKVGDDAIKLSEHILSIQKALLAANEEQTILVQTINDLEKKVAGVDKWEKEKARYELIALPPRIFVYSLRLDCAEGECSHKICQKCYQNGKKSLLNESAPVYGVYKLSCPECGTILGVGIFDGKEKARDQELYRQRLAEVNFRNHRRGF